MDHATANKLLPDELTFKTMSDADKRTVLLGFLDVAVEEDGDAWARGDICLALELICKGMLYAALEAAIRAFTPVDARQENYTGNEVPVATMDELRAKLAQVRAHG